MMLTLVFGLVDFSRAIYIAQVIANLTGRRVEHGLAWNHSVRYGGRGGGGVAPL